MAMVLNRIFRRFRSPIFGLINLLAAFHTFWNQLLVFCHRHTAGAPAGIWPVVRTYDAEGWGGGGEEDYNLTVIIQSKQWIYNIYNLFIIYITLFVVGITLLMIGIIIYTYISIIYIDIFIIIR